MRQGLRKFIRHGLLVVSVVVVFTAVFFAADKLGAAMIAKERLRARIVAAEEVLAGEVRELAAKAKTAEEVSNFCRTDEHVSNAVFDRKDFALRCTIAEYSESHPDGRHYKGYEITFYVFLDADRAASFGKSMRLDEYSRPARIDEVVVTRNSVS